MLVVRHGASLEVELPEALDKYLTENQFANRFHALRQLVNKHLGEKKWQCNNIVTGAITLVFNHHKCEIANNLAQIQRKISYEIFSFQRFELDKDHSIEIVAVKGISSRLTDLADKLISEKGIQHGKLTMSRAD